MHAEWTTCPMCGHRFDASEHLACRACPLNRDCLLLCCPACGFELINVRKSRLAQWVSRWLYRDRAANHPRAETEGHIHDIPG